MLNPQLTTELINGLRNQSQDSISKLCDDYAPALYAYILKIVANEDSAENILHQVFVIAWKTIESYDQGQQTFFVWILNIARNEAINALCQEDISVQQPIQNELANKFKLSAAFANGALSLIERTIITLTHCRNLGVNEIAEFLRLPAKFVQTKMQEASKKIELELVNFPA